jgi:predicted lipoprotein
MHRREFFVAITGVFFSACEFARPPAAPNAARSQIIQPTGKYAFEVIALQNIPNVAEALQSAGLELAIKDQDNWANFQSAGTFAGGLIQKISNIAGNWRIDIDGRPFCADVRHQQVVAGNRISCFLDDGIHVQGSCFG